MSDKHNHSNKEDASVQAFNQVLDRLDRTIERAELRSWDYLKEKVEEAVEVEQTAEEMTRDEVDLLKAYVMRDLGQLGHFAHETGEGIAAWLNFDLNYLEATFVERLKSLADKTQLEQERLREQLDHDGDRYMAGEITAGGTFECLECGKAQVLQGAAVLVPCHACESIYFKRSLGTWPL